MIHRHGRETEIALDHLLRRHRQRRDDAREDDAGDLRAIETGVRKEAFHQQAHLVAGSLAQGRQTPAVDDRRAVENAEDDVGVADVDR